MFYFDGRFRPVPLATTFVGVKALNSMAQLTDMNNICYDKAVDFVKKGHQVKCSSFKGKIGFLVIVWEADAQCNFNVESYALPITEKIDSRPFD